MIVKKINGDADLSSIDLEKWEVKGYVLNADNETYTVNVERILSNYEKTIIDLVRQRYSIDEELAIQRQKETKPEQWQEYFDYVEECKLQAKNI
jgi:hypothetical protein